MKLYYYRSKKGINNFGDDLNPYLWNKILSNTLDNDSSSYFVGIGTLINELMFKTISQAHHKVIFSSGVGYGFNSDVCRLDSSYKVYCVRGPLSARKLGISEGFAITDGAVLVRRFFTRPHNSKFKFSYMPHWMQAGRGWETVCKSLGFGYIDPRQNVETVLSLLGQTDVLLTEAMHGAIVADALRIPWVPIITHKDILAFKWQDWCTSIGVDYCPELIRRVRHPENHTGVSSLTYASRLWLSQKLTSIQLRKVALKSAPKLSSDTLIESLTCQIEEKLEDFKKDFNLGLYGGIN